MVEKTLQEIREASDEMRIVLSKFMVDSPNLTQLEIAKQVDLTAKTLQNFLYRKKKLQPGSAIKLYHFLHKLRLI